MQIIGQVYYCKVADIHIPPTSPDVTDLAKSGRIGVRNTLEAFYHTDEAKSENQLPTNCRYIYGSHM